MKTLIGIALLSLKLSMLCMPIIKRLAVWLKLLDLPSARKVHTQAIPRIGGVGIFFSCVFAFLPSVYVNNDVFNLLFREQRLVYLIAGAVLMFGVGLVDDVFGLRARVKLVFQIFSGVMLFSGGIRIDALGVHGIYVLGLNCFSLPATVFWVVLVINAINLLDGLDGLAAGVSFFVCLVLLALCIVTKSYLVALILASLCGAILGFLWYNFNPATIFMGDSGSYFIGYMIAALSMMGSIKSHAALTILIPIIAMGLPLMDTLFATFRRFVVGNKLFMADKDHFHHRLIKMGYSHRKAVFILYGISVVMAMFSVLLVYRNDAAIGVLLLMLLVGGVVGIRKLGYMGNVDGRRIARWGLGIFDEMGLHRKRRLLHAHQVSIRSAESVDDFWAAVVDAMQFLFVDFLRLQLWEDGPNPQRICEKKWHLNEKTKEKSTLYQHNRLYLRFPFERNGIYFGSLILSKEGFDSDNSKYLTLSHMEHLRRTMSETLAVLRREGKLRRSEVGGRRSEIRFIEIYITIFGAGYHGFLL